VEGKANRNCLSKRADRRIQVGIQLQRIDQSLEVCLPMPSVPSECLHDEPRITFVPSQHTFSVRHSKSVRNNQSLNQLYFASLTRSETKDARTLKFISLTKRRLRNFCSRDGFELEQGDTHTYTFEFTTMPSIPIDVLREILGHVRKANLVTLCRVNKIFCSCSQDVLYREIAGNAQTLNAFNINPSPLEELLSLRGAIKQENL
jgi:hypothetical protein